MSNPWFRMYSDFIYDDKVEFLAFEDQRHYVFLLCMKNMGLLDKDYPQIGMLEHVISRRLGIYGEAFENCKIRLMSVGLIDVNWQPLGWDDRQMLSDSSKDRVAKFRERQKKQQVNDDVTECNVTVTVQDKEEDKDIYKNTKAKTFSPPIGDVLLNAWKEVRKAKRAGPITEIAWAGIERESKKAGITTEQAVTICCERGWQSFKAEWLSNSQAQEQPKPAAHSIVVAKPNKPIDMKTLTNGLSLAKAALRRGE